MEKLKNILSGVNLTPISWLVGFSGILMVRFFLESISSKTTSGVVASDASTLVHYYLFFIGVAFATLIIFHFAIPGWRKVLPQFISVAFILLLLAPIIDFSASRGQGFTMTYLFQSPKDLLYSFLTFFGQSLTQGITLGIRVELAIILIMSGFLIYSERRSFPKTLGFVLLLYITVFAFGALPSLIALGQDLPVLTFFAKSIAFSSTLTNNLHATLVYSGAERALEVGFNFTMSKILFILSTILVSIYFLSTDKFRFIAILKNSRPERVLAYFSVISFGILLSLFIAPPKMFSWSDVLSIITLLLSFYFSWVFAVCVNDVVDEDIDKLSNSERPLIRGILSVEDLRQASYIFLTASIIAGFISGFYALFSVLAFTALYYIYSAPPTRFKQIPFFSSFLIALCKLSTLIAGFFLLSNSKVLSTLPTPAVLGVTVFFFLFVHLRDLKDIDGDKASGIKTPAIMFGPRFIGILVALAYLLLPLFFKIYYLYFFAVPAGLLSYHFCVKKPYKELPLFIIYFLFYFSIIIPILIFPHLL